MPTAPQQVPFWAKVSEIKAALGGEEQDLYYVTSLDNWQCGTTGGVVSHVTKQVAAIGIAKNTHRICTPEEAAAYEKDQADKAMEIQKRELKNAQKVLMFSSADLGLGGLPASQALI